MLDVAAPRIPTEFIVNDDLQCNLNPYLCLRQSSCCRQYVCRKSGSRMFRPNLTTVYAIAICWLLRFPLPEASTVIYNSRYGDVLWIGLRGGRL